MKILVVGQPFVVPQNRIAWCRLAEIHPEVNVTIIAPERWSTDRYGPTVEHVTYAEEHDNYSVLPLPLEPFPYTGGKLTRYVGLSRVLKSYTPDIFCITHNWTHWATLFALIQQQRHVPNARTIGFNVINIDYVVRRSHLWVKHAFFLRSMDGIFASDTDAKNILLKHGYHGKIAIRFILGATAEPEHLIPLEDRPVTPFTIGFVGRLSPEKGVADLIAAAARLEGDWQLQIVGDGPSRQALEAQADALNLSARVKFHGMLPRGEVLPFLQTCHALVLPSRTTADWKEQFGVVLVEAMLQETTVVGSSSGAIPEVIGDAGLIFPEGDVSSLAAVLQKLLDSPDLRQELAQRGRERALNLYSATAMAECFYQFSCELLAKE